MTLQEDWMLFSCFFCEISSIKNYKRNGKFRYGTRKHLKILHFATVHLTGRRFVSKRFKTIIFLYIQIYSLHFKLLSWLISIS